MSDLVTIDSSVLPADTRVLGFRGEEAISRPYEVEVFLSLPHEPGGEPDLADAIGAKAVLTVDRARLGVPPFHLAGVFAHVEVLHATEGRLLLRAVVVPRLWQLGLSEHSRIFTKMKVPDILREVLGDNGLTDVEMRLGSYEIEEHVCQYKESDLAFVSRWMEREGIFYFFEHGEDGEKLVLCDQRRYDDDKQGTPVRFFAQTGDDHSARDALRSFRCRRAIVPARVRLKDYDYAKPNLNVSGAAPVSDTGAGEVSLYGERFFSPAAGERLAKIRAEEIRAKEVVYQAEGTRLHLRAGAAFELWDHPLPSFNTRYLTVAARHSSAQANGFPGFAELTGITHDEAYRVDLDAVRAEIQYRAESVTPWPRIHGSENGVIDGPAESEYAQIDEQGRYNAKFKFDESKLKGGKATTFVRMMQPHGGDIEGFHFPLRKGTEVIFGFLGGDPDRPVISGVVPNALHPSPVTSGNHTKNVIQTGGRNRFEFEDKAGQQRVTMSTPYANTYVRMGSPNDEHEMIIHTDENTLLNAGLDFNVVVSKCGPGNWTTIVNEGDATLRIPQGDYRIGVEGGIGINAKNGVTLILNDSVEVPEEGGEGGLKIEVKKSEITLDTKEAIEITSDEESVSFKALSGDVHVTAKADHSVTIDGETWEEKTDVSTEAIIENSWEFRAGATFEDVKGDNYELRIGNKEAFTMGLKFDYTHGDKTEITNGDKTELFAGYSLDVTVGASSEHFTGNKFSLEVGSLTEIKVSALAELAASLHAELIFGPQVEVNAALKIGIDGISVKLAGEHVKAKSVKFRNSLCHTHFGGSTLRGYGFVCHVP
jgi:type VI secretion system secreted protein VgrG